MEVVEVELEEEEEIDMEEITHSLHLMRRRVYDEDSDFDTDDEDDVSLYDMYANFDYTFNRSEVQDLNLEKKCKLFVICLQAVPDTDDLWSAVVKHCVERQEEKAYHCLVRELGCETGPPTEAERRGLYQTIRQRASQSFRLSVILDVLKEHADGMRMSEDERYYPVGNFRFDTECCVCLEKVTCSSRPCCGSVVCTPCLVEHLSVRLQDGQLRMPCLAVDCDKYVVRAEVNHHLSDADRVKYQRFLEKANQCPTKKTCPKCCEITTVSEYSLKTASKKRGLEVVCASCSMVWCFTCHAPEHKGITCNQFQKGDVLLRQWARTTHGASPNAQKCPNCNFYIERIEGCDHMTCSKCNADFCYACGHRRRKLKLVGHHGSRLSVLGCPRNLHPNNPHIRRLIRGTIFSSALVGGISAAALVIPVGAAVAAIGLPIFGVYKGVQKARQHHQSRRSRAFHRRNRRIYEEQLSIARRERESMPRDSAMSLRDSDFSMWEDDLMLHRLFKEENDEDDDEEFIQKHFDLLEGTELDPSFWIEQLPELRALVEGMLSLDAPEDNGPDSGPDNDEEYEESGASSEPAVAEYLHSVRL